ncbi:arsenite methyltransferase [Planctomycetota bacterium]
MQNVKDDQIRQTVRKTYGQIAKTNSAGCGCSPSSCCSSTNSKSAEDISIGLGYSNDDVSGVPEGANMGLGCGNPQAIASLQEGEVVLDLGSGSGFDCFLAAKAVGDTGRVIGVDMTPEMISKARENATKSGLDNVEFRLGEIESLSVADEAVDVVMSNCVINLSPEKPKVFKEVFRILKSGGRLAITDIVATSQLPEDIRQNLELHAGCIAGAAPIADLESMLKEAGFTNISIKPIEESREAIRQWFKDSHVADFVVSATIEAVKP